MEQIGSGRPGIKVEQIQKCCLCGLGVMASGIPLFFRVRAERFGIDMTAVNRQAGLEQFFGGGGAGARLAQVMGDGRDIAVSMSDAEREVFLCERCCNKHPILYQLCMDSD